MILLMEEILHHQLLLRISRVSWDFIYNRWLAGFLPSAVLHPWKLTWHWKIPILNRKHIFIHGGCSIVIWLFRGLGSLWYIWRKLCWGTFPWFFCGCQDGRLQNLATAARTILYRQRIKETVVFRIVFWDVLVFERILVNVPCIGCLWM